MIQRYKQHFENLSPEETEYVSLAINRAHPDHQPSGDLYEWCEGIGLDQASVVMSMADDPSPMAVVCLEKLVGHPIVRQVPKPQKRATRTRGPAVRRSDPRRIVNIQPNPKKPGTKSHERYEMYQEGTTVNDFVAAGGSTADVKWDSERGFITLEAPNADSH